MENYGLRKSGAAFLPFDILASVFQFLNTRDKGKAAQVCTSWEDALRCKSLWKRDEVTLRERNIRSLRKNRSFINKGIKRFRVLDFGPQVEKFLRSIPDKEHLQFTDDCIDENLFHFFESVPTLKSLNLTGCTKVSDDVLLIIIYLIPFLRELNISECPQIRNDGLKNLVSGMKRLKSLHIGVNNTHHLSLVSALGIGYLAGIGSIEGTGLVSLEKLHLNHIPRFTTIAFKHISQNLTNLVVLDLQKCVFNSNCGFRYLSQLKKLENLNLAHSKALTDDSLFYIARITTLKTLDLTACKLITDSGCKYISGLKNLTCLNLSLCLKVTDDSLKHLNKLPALQELNLQCCKISPVGLFHLAAGDLKLTQLKLVCCFDRGDRGILHICQSTLFLRDISPSCTQLTDYGISQIVRNFFHLSTVNLESRCHSFSHNNLTKIRNISLEREDYWMDKIIETSSTTRLEIV